MQTGSSRCREKQFPTCIICIICSLLFYANTARADTTDNLATFRTVRLGTASADVSPRSTQPGFAQLLRGSTRVDSHIDLFQKNQHVYALLEADDFDTDLLVLISIARGIGQRPLYTGATWEFGNDWVCQFRRVGDRVHFVRRNIRYRAQPGTAAAAAIAANYSDSILAALPVAAERDNGAVLVDLSPVFLSDLPNVEKALAGFKFNRKRSSWSTIEGFPRNLELEVSATYSSDGRQQHDSIPDSRALTVGIHYSMSRLPNTGYQPRLADDRIGYFLSVSKDYSGDPLRDRFVRYINRWHLEKSDPSLPLSKPTQPIVFWLEKTVPLKYRATIRAGILEWNKAFERIGFQDAIVVRQQADDATWSPGDIRYNTFRWITSGLSVALGPTRMNPLTGQILDADIVFDADYLQTWKRKYEDFSPKDVTLMTGGMHDLNSYRQVRSLLSAERRNHSCLCQDGFAHQLALSSAVLARTARSRGEIERLTQQGIKKTVMHEVGHTLGLRHNFKGSTYYSVEEMLSKSRDEQPQALSASVMDYLPAQFSRAGEPQGRYYTPTLGPYDFWAIEYGYRQFEMADTESEQPYLQAIASRSAEKGHAFATDENTRGIDADPDSGVYDMGDDQLEFAEHQARLVAESWEGLIARVTSEGDGYQRSRQAFGVLLATHGRAMYSAAKYIGGVHTSRSHLGDPGATQPYEVVDADRQRRTLQLLSKYIFSDEPFQAPLQVGTQLATTHWNHWGSEVGERSDFPAHQSILVWQQRIVDKLLSPLTLSRLHDTELLVPPDKDAFTVAELLESMTREIFSELWSVAEGEYSNRRPAISSLRRNLQATVLEEFESLVESADDVPAVCTALAANELSRIAAQSRELLASDLGLDSYTRAHLAELARRVDLALER